MRRDGLDIVDAFFFTESMIKPFFQKQDLPMPYLTKHRDTLGERHYITSAQAETHWFNFHEGRLRDFLDSYGDDFCLVIDCSSQMDDAFILPYKEFKDLFTQDLLDGNHRWVGSIRNEVIRISAGGAAKEREASNYHDSFHLLQDAPQPVPKRPDYE